MYHANRNLLEKNSQNISVVPNEMEKFHMGIWLSKSSLKFCKLSLFSLILNSKFKFDLIGYGVKHTSTFHFKINSAIEYMSSLPQDHVVILFDGFDVLLQVSAEDIYMRYVKMGMPDVLSVSKKIAR